MRGIAFAILVLVAAAGPVGAGPPPANPDAVAIIIGNANYEAAGHDVPDVAYAHNDAEAFRRFAREMLGIEERKIFAYTDLTAVEMQRLFGTADSPGRLDRLVALGNREVHVFYSGHGVPRLRPDQPAEGYLLPVDVPAASPQFGGYPLERLKARLEALPADRVALYLDACFSGLSQAGTLVQGVSGTFGVAVAAPEPKATVSILAATAFDEPQFAHWLPEKEHGAFTYHLLTGLYGAADADRYGRADGAVTAAEVRAYLLDRMSLEVLTAYDRFQTPSLSGSGEVVLAALGDAATRPVFPRRTSRIQSTSERRSRISSAATSSTSEPSIQMTDSKIVWAHQHSAGEKGGV